MSSFNFNTINKKFLTVTLSDEDKTKILISSPTKKMLDRLIGMEETIRKGQVEGDSEAIDAIYDLCELIMNRNKADKKISKELIEETLDIEDITFFLNEYMEFVSKNMEGKN